ncbi:MAG: hypothetical protein H6735_00240 [Alphaproteobacteria bacterium]|nr:hypothetical protein [Alphaproteobacteria bacterium]
MVRAWPVVLGTLIGCGGGNELVAELDGSWAGSMVDPESGTVELVADFEWREDEELLFGTVDATPPGQAEPWIFAVRRWDTGSGLVLLDLTDEADGTRGLDLDGTVDGGSFSGTATLSYDCDGSTCGYEGDFELTAE